MNEPIESFELELEPIPPETISSAKIELLQIIEKTLGESKQTGASSEDEIQIEVEQTFPTDAVIVVVITFLTQVALESYKTILLPKLKKRFKVRRRTRRKHK